jgi:predicted transposase YbfD/YdcC
LKRAGDEQAKQTNEIGAFIPLIESLDLAGKTLTADALLTQRTLATYIVEHRGAHYVFTVKGNQPTLLSDLQLAFAPRGQPDFREPATLAHGRIESRAIWTSTQLNGYLDFPQVGQAYLIERSVVHKKSGKTTTELAYGITSHSPASASPAQVLALNRNHWTIENSCHWVLDWNWDEDRSRIRSGYGPENITRLRRFAIGVIKAKSRNSVAATLRKLQRNVRLVFDYLCMTRNSARRPHAMEGAAGRTN